MKLERISENQIRCTLGKADLADKELLLNELAYGTDKAKELFREMMMQASNELGFEVDDIPLMIEAIPVSPECLILIITKVEDPEELDTRFSRFSKPSNYYEDDIEDDSEEDIDNSSDAIMNVIDNIVEDIERAKDMAKEQGAELIPLPVSLKKKAIEVKEKASNNSDADIFKVYCFNSLNDITTVAKLLRNIYNGDNSIYKNPSDSKYYLVLSRSNNTSESFTRACNLISEYGIRIKTTYATPYHYTEHYKLILKEYALQTLSII